jgi:hypothetical protein
MVCGSLWNAAVYSGVGVPVGGTLTLVYDNGDKAIEAQFRDDEGRIVNRLIRTYDANGRVLEEKSIQENPELLFDDCDSTEQQPEFSDPEEEIFQTAMTLTLRGQLPSGISYTRDTQGRVIEMREGSFAFFKLTTTRYNKQGYKAGEQIAFVGKSVSPIGATASKPAVELPISTVVRVQSDIHYAYEYDGNGNWTQQTQIDRTRPNNPSIVSRRTLTYF